MALAEQQGTTEAIISSFTHLPEGVNNIPLGVVSTVAVAGILAYRPIRDSIAARQSRNDDSVVFPNTNPFNSTVSSAGPAIEAVLNEAPIEPEQASRINRQMKLRRAVAAGGLTYVALAAFGPYYNSTAPVPGSTVIIRDSSLSFLHTMDGSEGSRLASANAASTTAFSADDYPVSGNSVYVIDFGDKATSTPKLETKDAILQAIETPPAPNPNGGAFNEALELAKGIVGTGSPEEPSGTIIIQTDGAFDDRSSAARELKKLSETTNLTVAHIGNSPAVYQLPGQSRKYDSSSDTTYLKKLNPDDATIITSSNSSEIAASIKDQLAATSYHTEQRPWLVPILLAGSLLTMGTASLYKLASQQLKMSKSAIRKS